MERDEGKEEKQEVKKQEHEAPAEVSGITSNVAEAEAFDRISKMEELLNLKVKEEVSEAAAFNQVSIFMNYYRVNVKNIALAEGPKAVETILNRVIQAIMEGQLEITETNELTVTQTLISSPEKSILTYQKIQARHDRAMDDITGERKRMLAFVSALTSIPIKDLAVLQGADKSVMVAVSQLFTLV